EQDRNHGSDAPKMSGPGSPFERVGEPLDINIGRKAGRIYLGLFGSEDDINVKIGQEGGIAREVAGVPIEIGSFIELGRVNENGNDQKIGQFAGAADQFEMAVVERAHCRNERDGLTVASSLTGERCHSLSAADYLHRVILSRRPYSPRRVKRLSAGHMIRLRP